MPAPRDIITRLVDVCHRLYARGMVTATDGNVSARLPSGRIVMTRSGVNKGMVTGEEDVVELTPDGRQTGGSGKPSTEAGMHLYIYTQRRDVQAVVHAHPPYATGFATAHLDLTQCTFPEVIVGLGAIPLAEYATPSTGEVAESLTPFVHNSDAILLANHGVVTYGSDLFDAYFKMEKVEHAAQITYVARVLGGPRALTAEHVSRLRDVSVRSYGKDFSDKIACEIPDMSSAELTEPELRQYIARKLQQLGLR